MKRRGIQEAQRISDEWLLEYKFGDGRIGTNTAPIVTPTVIPQMDVSKDEVREILRTCRNRSAPGSDGVSYWALKRLNIIRPEILSNLYSAYLRHQVFPEV